MEQKPTIGRVVIYKTTQQERDLMSYNTLTAKSNNQQTELPAIITAVWGPTTINVQVLMDGQNGTYWKTSIVQGDQEGNWNWPSRV